MSWRVVAGKATGTSHHKVGKGCEDAYWAGVVPGSTQVLAMFVADGAGTAAHGALGAQMAVDAALRFVGQSDPGSLGEEVARQCVESVRAEILSAAVDRDLAERDLACTFLGLISSPTSTLAFQVGDGGIVVDVGQGLELTIHPMNGVYANETRFVTDADALDRLQSRTYPARARHAAVFSDGLQRLALDFREGDRPYPDFFDPLFQVVSSAPQGRDAQLQEALARFLTSPDVNSRTDDDKSLAIAVLLPDPGAEQHSAG
jgi:hypothetical protein